MFYVVWLLWDNRASAAGYDGDSDVLRSARYSSWPIFVIRHRVRLLAALGNRTNTQPSAAPVLRGGTRAGPRRQRSKRLAGHRPKSASPSASRA